MIEAYHNCWTQKPHYVFIGPKDTQPLPDLFYGVFVLSFYEQALSLWGLVTTTPQYYLAQKTWAKAASKLNKMTQGMTETQASGILFHFDHLFTHHNGEGGCEMHLCVLQFPSPVATATGKSRNRERALPIWESVSRNSPRLSSGSQQHFPHKGKQNLNLMYIRVTSECRLVSFFGRRKKQIEEGKI